MARWLLILLCLTSSTVSGAEYDLVVYGGTSAGVIAAVQAQKMGKSVVIVCPDKHLGGLSAGGLGFTDTGSYLVPDLAALRLHALSKPDDFAYAVVYEHDAAGVWIDIVTRYQDGTSITYSTAKKGGELCTIAHLNAQTALLVARDRKPSSVSLVPNFDKKPEPDATSDEPEPKKGDWIDHRQFGLCRVDGEGVDGGLLIRLPSGMRKVVHTETLEVMQPRFEGDRRIFPLRPRTKR